MRPLGIRFGAVGLQGQTAPGFGNLRRVSQRSI